MCCTVYQLICSQYCTSIYIYFPESKKNQSALPGVIPGFCPIAGLKGIPVALLLDFFINKQLLEQRWCNAVRMEIVYLFNNIKTESVMKKMIAIFVLACTFSVGTVKAEVKSNATAFVQPFSQSYALTSNYLWFTDIDLTNPTGSYCDIWYEMEYLRSTFPGYSFSHYNYGGLLQFEFGYSAPLYFATIYSDLPQ
jgi:hypothetical protein